MYYYDSGDKYTGNWEHGKQCGHGVYVYANGDRYEGNWSMRVRSGKGVYTHADGRVEDGIWWSNKLKRTTAEDRILRACILDKSDGKDMSVYVVRKAVESTCEDISKNPSWLDKLRY